MQGWSLLHGVAFYHIRADGPLHGEGCLQDVQTALCTFPLSWGANLYTYIGPMVLKSSILATWQAGRWNDSNCDLNRQV